VLTDRSFGIFFFTMTTTYLAFVEWPARVNVLYDGDCGICEKTRDFFQRLDFEQRFHWTPFQFARSLFGISEDALGSRMHIEANGNIYSGFAAFQRLVLYNPVSYFVWLLFMKLPQPAGLHFRKYLAVGLLVLFSPIFAPIGGWAYDLFARNRYKMPGKTVCAVPPSAGRAPEEN
jgi:predicted DCC family thiol-disulfide oxidoreductase YuxK